MSDFNKIEISRNNFLVGNPSYLHRKPADLNTKVKEDVAKVRERRHLKRFSQILNETEIAGEIPATAQRPFGTDHLDEIKRRQSDEIVTDPSLASLRGDISHPNNENRVEAAAGDLSEGQNNLGVDDEPVNTVSGASDGSSSPLFAGNLSAGDLLEGDLTEEGTALAVSEEGIDLSPFKTMLDKVAETDETEDLAIKVAAVQNEKALKGDSPINPALGIGASDQQTHPYPIDPLKISTGTSGPTGQALKSISDGLLKGGNGGALGSDANQHSGMSQGEGGMSNPSLILSSEMQTIGRTEGVQKGNPSFQGLLDAGLDIPDEGAILRQVSKQIRSWRPGKNEPIRFLLEPKHLGALQIDIMLQDKGVSAHIVTADPFVKALLEGNQTFLQNGLEDHGLHVEQFSVDLGGNKGFFSEKREKNSLKRNLSFTPRASDIHSIQAMSGGRLNSRQGGVSLYI